MAGIFRHSLVEFPWRPLREHGQVCDPTKYLTSTGLVRLQRLEPGSLANP